MEAVLLTWYKRTSGSLFTIPLVIFHILILFIRYSSLSFFWNIHVFSSVNILSKQQILGDPEVFANIYSNHATFPMRIRKLNSTDLR